MDLRTANVFFGALLSCALQVAFHVAPSASATRVESCLMVPPPCHIDAYCIMSRGSSDVDSDKRTYRCECAPGFVGDGICCQTNEIAERICRNNTCSQHANCVPRCGSISGDYQCVCKEGYRGNGMTCEKVNQDSCAGKCGALLVSDVCGCDPGCGRKGDCCFDYNYTCNGCGSGVLCKANEQCISTYDHPGYICECSAGYSLSGSECIRNSGTDGVNAEGRNQFGVNPFGGINPFGVNPFGVNPFGINSFGINQFGSNLGLPVLPYCYPGCALNAQCVSANYLGQHQCRCNNGYVGNGYSCAPTFTSAGSCRQRCRTGTASSYLSALTAGQFMLAMTGYPSQLGYTGYPYQTCSCQSGCRITKTCCSDYQQYCNNGCPANYCRNPNQYCVLNYGSQGFTPTCKCREGFHASGNFCVPFQSFG